MVVFMARGLFTTLKFRALVSPVRSCFLFFWEVVFCLERMGFKVNQLIIIVFKLINHISIATTFDSASVNRRLVAIHNTREKILYKLLNNYIFR